jgi:hypothetical protein
MDDQINPDVELDDEDEVMEAHDPKNAEAKSAKSVDKAGKAGPKKAPARKGDKSNSEPMVKTKAQIVQAAFTKMSEMTRDDLEEFLGDFIAEELEDEDLSESSFDANAELSALVESEATLSEEFKEKTAILFETALKTKISEEVDRLEAQYEENLSEALELANSQMVEQVDSFLNHVVENWMEENKLAIHNGLRTEIAEGFMDGLKTLFAESYIEVPESKVDLVDDLAEQVEELQEKLNRSMQKGMELSESVESMKRDKVLSEMSRGLADTQAEKLATLAEGLEFTTSEAFARKLKIVKESYFSSTTTPAAVLEEASSDDGDTISEASPMMEQYLKAIRKTQ